MLVAAPASQAASSLHDTIRDAQRKVVKIYGAGGFQGLEGYQTGILVSTEGHVLTALSYVLDAPEVTVVLDDGRRFVAEQLGVDPVTELAMLKLPLEEGESLAAIDLTSAHAANVGDRVLALSNLYNIAGGDEPVSVLQGIVTAIAPLDARRGGFQSNFHGRVYIVDAAANNPGAAGGALVDWQGRLLGVLGKELKSRSTGAWLHYALPIDEIAATVDRLQTGDLDSTESDLPEPIEPLSLADLGLVLVPDVLARTPPYVDAVHPNSPAAAAGLRPDDLVVFVGGEPTDSCRSVTELVGRQERYDELQIAVLRDGEFIEASLVVDEFGEDPDNESADEPVEEILEQSDE
jgi:S1-C subfamily serine protease